MRIPAPKSIAIAAAVVMFALVIVGALSLRAAQRDIPFDAQRWKEPHWAWDRWRMVADLQRVLNERRPSKPDVLRMLEGRFERSPSRAIELAAPGQADVVRYRLGRRPPGKSGSGDLIIFFTPDGGFGSCQLHGDAL